MDKNGNNVQITRNEFKNNPDMYIHHYKGRIVLNNGIIHKYVLPNELDKYLSNGWVKRGLSRNKFVKSQIKGFVWITNGKKQIRINKDELDKYVKLGWTVGICQKTTKGYIKLTNNIDNVSIDPNNIEQINHYLSLGWKYGITRDVQKHIWINDTFNSKMILYSDLQKYLDEGWVKGNCNINAVTNNGKIVINKDGKNKFIYRYLGLI